MILNRIFIFLLTLSFAFTLTAEAKLAERPQWARSMDGVTYWFLRNLVLDVDEMLSEKGLQAKYCVYRSHAKGDTPYSELGRCLYDQFTESMTTAQNSGVTYLWLAGTESGSSPIEIHWRAPQSGWSKYVNQVLEMKFEGPLYWLRNRLGDKKSAEDIHYTQFIGGELKMVIPDDESLLSALGNKGNPWVTQYLKKLRRIELDVVPSERVDGVVVHTGSLIAELVNSNGENEKFNISVQTNLNVVVMSRKFYLRVKNSSSEEMGPLPGVSHAP